MTRATAPRTPAGSLTRAAQEMRPHAAQAAGLLRALANEQRLMILCHLVPGPLTVGELNSRLPLSQSALSQHLAVLRESGILQTEREAQSVRYSLPAGLVTRLLGLLHERFCENPDPPARTTLPAPKRRTPP